MRGHAKIIFSSPAIPFHNSVILSARKYVRSCWSGRHRPVTKDRPVTLEASRKTASASGARTSTKGPEGRPRSGAHTPSGGEPLPTRPPDAAGRRRPHERHRPDRPRRFRSRVFDSTRGCARCVRSRAPAGSIRSVRAATCRSLPCPCPCAGPFVHSARRPAVPVPTARVSAACQGCHKLTIPGPAPHGPERKCPWPICSS